ncbi:MAG: hypothetical protein J3K34DRAFT_483343 [Monoraphidium minutum]|nr:MAG: hypothetical protein J3K34DRAFT_483343 [Monoraphidium minutum]
MSAPPVPAAPVAGKKDALRQQQAAADSAFATRLMLACLALAVTLWVTLPGCDQERGEAAPSLLARLFGAVPEPPPAAAAGKVPHIIHQLHSSAQVPARFVPFQESWKQHHPSWTYRLWTPEEVDQLAKEKFPWFAATFSHLAPAKMKEEAARYMILHAHGGVYADLDVASFRPIDPLVRGCAGLVGLLSDDLAFAGNVPAALLAGAPGHPMWADALRAVKAATRGGRFRFPGDVTPAMLLKACVSRFVARHGSGGGADAAAAAAAAAPLSGAAAIREAAGGPVRAVRLPGLCIAPGGAAYPYDFHVAPGERVDDAEELRTARACSSGSPAFDPTECNHLLGIISAAAYTIAYWEHVPLLDHPRRGSVFKSLPHNARGAAAFAAAALVAAAAAALLLRSAARWLLARLRGRGGSGGKARRTPPPPPVAARRRRRGDRVVWQQDSTLATQASEEQA